MGRRRELVARLCASALALAFGAPSLAAQGEPLNLGIIGVTSTVGPSSASMAIPDAGGRVQLVVGINGLADTVTLQWMYETPSTAAGVLESVIDTDFKPTAAAGGGGTGTTLYVAGRDGRSGATIVEAWAFTGAEVFAPEPDVGADDAATARDAARVVEAAFREPTLTRTELLRCDTLGPILDLVRHPATGELILLEHAGGAQRAVRRFAPASGGSGCDGLAPLSAGTPAAVLDSDTLPALAGLHSIWAGRRTDGGFALFFDPAPVWRPSRAPLDAIAIVALADLDEDGTFEHLEATTVAGFFRTFDIDEFDLDDR